MMEAALWFLVGVAATAAGGGIALIWRPDRAPHCRHCNDVLDICMWRAPEEPCQLHIDLERRRKGNDAP